MDKGAKKALEQLGLHPSTAPFMLPKDEARDMGATCRDCGSKKVVYFISKPFKPFFDPGGYCYTHLLERCRRARMIPYPIEQTLFDSLKEDMSIPGHPVQVIKIEIP
jgi:hypothetical protein